MSTFQQIVPAFSHLNVGWHSIKWDECHKRVRGLQIRIAKATKDQQWRKVKSLQRMLVRSFSAKSVAVKRVTENTGKKTPGVDGETWSTPAEKWLAVSRLKRTGYKPKPLKRVNIPKQNGKTRPLGIPTMLDRAMQALYLLALEPVSETTADRNSYGFRPMRSTADAIRQTHIVLCRWDTAEWILEGDIKGCFDNISHHWLLANIPMDKQILSKWLNAGYMDKGQLNPTYAGTPQGGIISPVLANMALDGLEDELEAYFGEKSSREGKRNKINYVRYADDFVITGASRELLEGKVKPVVEAFMAERGLTLSVEKTKVTHITEGFDFLGQNVRRFGRKVLVRPSKKNLASFLAKIRNMIKENKAVPAWQMIRMLNPLIRGWVNYHRHVAAKESFSYVDHHIWASLWRWCVRRHPHQGKLWVKQKYFRRIATRDWYFSDQDPQGKLVTLYKADETPIKRHVKIRGNANSYDPADECYFEQRIERVWRSTHQGKEKMRIIWQRQQMKCPLCKQYITHETGWHIHHIIERCRGGDDRQSNLAMLHPNCHRQLHSIVTGSRKGGLHEA
ncbi:TPA: group II intron reverse transcriptase/maturase [Serratia rubidaea]|nr:group II intron reverse transcriptase/maturase [Serratia rubidaea]HDJ1451286.1 group II intron reverse transcriptase/maturase [Serratia rubidaea]HDJ1464237.1 group II intron reverse transcriptase/maturase [Serratia rubidaea]HDJ2774807.1 group II intron reverse transcriptase/maturase [Serratia rubidaea]